MKEQLKTQPEIDPDFVKKVFDAVIFRGERGPKNTEAEKLYLVFKSNENCGVSIEEASNQFSHTKNPIKSVSKAIRRVDKTIADMGYDLGIEARRFEGKITYHLRRRAG